MAETVASQAARRRYLHASMLGFMGLLVLAAITLPPIISGGYALLDPVILSTLVGLPACLFWWQRLRSGEFAFAARGFVWTTFAIAWVFTVAIQGSGYLVGNYAYLTTIVLLAAFFLDLRHTAAIAGANIAGVLIIHTINALSMRDLALSLAYMVIFSTLLVLIAGLMEQDGRAVHRKAVALARSNDELVRVSAERQAILDHTQDGIVHMDDDGRLRSLNRRAADMFRELWEQVPAPGTHLPTVIPPEHRPRFLEALVEAHQHPVEGVQAVRNRMFRVRLQALRGPDGDGFVLFAADTTAEVERQARERELLKQRFEVEKLEEVTHMQRNFINMASHELQTPLTPLRLQLHVLRDRQTGPLNTDQLDAIEVMERNTVRLSGLVEQIIDVARLDSGRLRVELGDVELVALTEEQIHAASPLLADKEIRVELERPAAAWVRGDARRLGQVVGHLLSNAIKFTPHGGVIRINADTGDPISWSISDNGIGIAAEHMGRLFQPFSQVHGSPGEYPGTGLGLAISRGLIEAQGGTLEAASPGLGGGATFTFALPVADVQLEEGERSTPSP